MTKFATILVIKILLEFDNRSIEAMLINTTTSSPGGSEFFKILFFT